MFDNIERLMLAGLIVLLTIMWILIRILAAVEAQTKWLKDEDEINSIGNES